MILKRATLRLGSAALALSLGLAVIGVAAGSSAVSAETEAVSTDGVTITLAPDAQGALAPNQDLVVRATIHNGTGALIGDGAAELFLDRDAVGSTTEFAAWLSPEAPTATDDLGSSIAALAFTGIAPGTTRDVTFTVPAGAIALPATERGWGTRLLGLRVTSAGAEIGQGRSAIVWNPAPAYTPVRVSIAIPLSTPAGQTGLISSEALAFYTAPAGILTRQLDAIINTPVAIGIDPMIIVSIRVLGNAAPPSAIAWLDRLAAARNETFALTYADSDITAALQAGSAEVLAPLGFGFAIDPARFAPAPDETETEPEIATPAPTDEPTDAPAETPTPVPTDVDGPPALPTTESLLAWNYRLPGIAWPAESTVVASDLGTLAAAGYSTTILDDTNATRSSSDPAAAATIDDHRVIVGESVISDLLHEAAFSTTDADWADAMARLSAAIAIVAGERPAESSLVFASTGRGWPTSGFHLSETLNALVTLGWSTTAPISEVINAAPASATLTPQSQRVERVGRVAQLLAAFDLENQFATVVSDPLLITAERRLAVLALLAQSWDANSDGWPAAVTDYLTQSADLRSAVQIVDSSTINFATQSAPIPITVSNSLDVPVTVYITARALTPILSVEQQRIELTIEPDSQAKGQIPVKSISNGAVTLQVSLSSVTGVAIGSNSLLNINVQAEWETAGALIIASLVVLVFGFGLYRNISKRRRERKEAHADADGAE